MPAAVFEPVEEVSVEFTPIEEVKPKAISFEPVEEVTPRKNIAQFLAEPDAGVTESSPLTPGALPSVSNNLSTPFPKTEREMIEQQVPENDQPLRIGEQPATLPRFGKKGTVSRSVSDVISGLGEWALNKPEEFAATFTPLAPAIALRYAPEIAQQFAGDVVEGAKGDRQALGRALAMAGLVGIPKGAEVARERWLLSGKAREAVPTPDEAARAGMRPEQPGEPMVRPPQEPLPVKPAPIDFVPEAVVEQPALAKITEEMNAAVDEAAKAGAELPVQHEAVLPGASETFKEITGEEPTTKGAENASSQQSTATLHGPLLRVGESARRENEAGLPVNEGGEGVRGNENQRATQTQGEVINLGHERLLPNRPELQTPEEFTAGEIQKLAVSKLGNLDERSPASIVFDISEWTTNAKREAQSIPETFTYSPEGTGKYLIEFPAGTRPKNALESLVEAIKQGDGPGDSWLPLNQYEAIKQAIKRGDPVNSDAAKSYGIRLPKGYTESGGVYWKLDSKEAGKKPTSKPPRTPSVEPPEVSSVRGNEVQEPAVARSEEAVTPTQTPRDWDAYYEELVGDLDSFRPARDTGQINYDLEDVAQRFVDYAKADTSGKPLNELVRDFAKTDEATASQIRKLRASVKKLEETEATKPSVAEPEAPAKTKTPSEEPTPEFPRRFVWPGHEALVSKDLATGKWRVTEFEVGESGELKPLRHDLFNSYNEAVIDQASNSNRREVALDTQAGTPAGVESGPGLVGMGGAVPGEFGPGSVSSIMFAAIDKDLAEMGKPPMKRGEPRTWDQDMQIATARMNRDPQWIPNLIAEVKDHPRPLSSWETMGMNLQKAYWKAQANDALKRIAQASEDGNQPELVRAKQDAARFEDNILDLYDAVGRGGTGSEAGRSLQAQKIGLTDDLSLVEMRLEARARTKDGKLTPEIEKEVERIHKEYQEKISKLEKATAEADKRRIDAETRATLAEIARQTAEKQIPPPHIQKLIKAVGDTIHERANAARERLKGKLFTLSPDVLKDLAEIGADNIWTIGEDFGRWSVKMVEDIGERVKPHLQAVWDASKKLIEDTWEGKAGKKSKTPAPPKVIELAKQTIKKGDSTVQQREKLTARIADRYQKGELDKITPSVQKLARTFIQDGIRDREELIDAVHEVIGNKIPEWTRRDTMDAISGYGDYKSLSKDQISVILRDLKGQMQQIAKLEDMASGQAPLRSGLERREVTEAQFKLIKLVNEAKRKGGYETTDPTKQLRTALDEVKKRTASQIAEYERRIAEKDYSVRKSTPVKEDAALNQARYELKQVKRKWTTQKKAWDYANRPWWERKLDFVAGLRRFNVLSGPKTLLKLLAYSATKTGTSLSTEIAGAGIQRLPILTRIAQYAPSEGRSSVTDFARSYSKAVTKGMKDAYDVATKHESELKSLYDPRAPEPFHWTQFNGLLHEVEKAPLRRAAFELSKTKRIENAIRRNADVTDDAVMTAIKYEAYQDSQRALLLEDNKLASSIRAMWRTLESKSKATGETSVGGKILATAGRTELPILTVPLNFAKQTIEGALGLPLGLAKVTRAWFKGIDNLADHPAEADAIFRNLKNGSVGGAIALYAFFDGYYGWNNFGGYYEPGEKRKSSDAAFGTIKLGGYNIPSVLLHNPFVEAGMVANTMGRLMSPRKGSKAEPVPAAVVASALGLMEHSPLGTEATSFSEMAVGRDRMNAINKHLASYFTPQFTRNIADWTDSEKRNPKTFTQHIEMGIPGLRQNVPVKRERRP